GHFFTNWMFVPAFRNGAAPFQTWNWQFVTVTNAWHLGGGGVPNAQDVAIIELQDVSFNGVLRRIGDITGYAGYQTLSLFPNHITAVGYPGNIDSAQIMHRVDAGAFQTESPNCATIGSDMTGGSSGGGWFQNFGQYGTGQPTGLNTGGNRLIGVTSYGRISPDPKVQGSSILDS